MRQQVYIQQHFRRGNAPASAYSRGWVSDYDDGPSKPYRGSISRADRHGRTFLAAASSAGSRSWGAARLSETSGCGKLNRNRR